MMHAHTHNKPPQAEDLEHQFNLIRTSVIVGVGLFCGAVLGGVAGLFVYANSRNPSAHDGFFVAIQMVGVIAGVALGYLAAKSVETQEQIVEASSRAGVALLKKYRTRPGGSNGNVGHRKIGSSLGDDYLRQLLSNMPKPQSS